MRRAAGLRFFEFAYTWVYVEELFAFGDPDSFAKDIVGFNCLREGFTVGGFYPLGIDANWFFVVDLN